MITYAVNLLKKNPWIWKWAKLVAYAILALKAWILVGLHNLNIKLGSAQGVTDINREIPLIVSFTSFGKRVNRAHITANSILCQSLKADRVILWLGFGEKISPELEKLKKRGLEILFCEDIRAYTKIIPTLTNYPDSTVVTADDDIIYPKHWLKKLYKAHLKNPGVICCHRAHLITKNEKGSVKPYNDWEWCIHSAANISNIFPTGVGGVLYPIGSLHPEVLNREAFQKLCPYADDIWLKAMSLKQGTVCYIIENKPLLIPLSVPNTQKSSALRTINIDQNQNDIQFKNVFTHYDLHKMLN